MNFGRWKGLVNRYLINGVILVIAWGGMFRRSFNCDTLAHMVNTKGDMAIMMSHGRYLVALQDWLLYQVGLSTTTHTGITAMAEVALLALAVCILQRCFEDKIINPSGIYEQLAWISISSLVFSNVLFAESFMFGECALMFGMAYLLATVGIWAFTRKKYLWAFLFSSFRRWNTRQRSSMQQLFFPHGSLSIMNAGLQKELWLWKSSVE